jgi:hypothetical protein
MMVARREGSSRVVRKAVRRAEGLVRLPEFDPSACHAFVTGVIDARAPVTLESDGRVWILDDRKWVGVHVRDGEHVTLSHRNLGLRRSRVHFRAERGALYFFRARAMFRRSGVLLKATRTSSEGAVRWEVP